MFHTNAHLIIGPRIKKKICASRRSKSGIHLICPIVQVDEITSLNQQVGPIPFYGVNAVQHAQNGN